LAYDIKKKLDVNDCSLARHILIRLLHYLVKFRSRSLAVYNNVDTTTHAMHALAQKRLTE